MIKNNKGITLIALIVTIIVLIIIAGISIATLTSDNGVIRQVNTAKVTQIEATAREQMDLACSAMRLAIAQASAQDNSYRANKNAEKIQDVLLNTVKADSTELESESWKEGTLDAAAGTFTITYEGDDYKNACNDDNAIITYTITLAQRSIEVTDVATGIKGTNGSDINIDVGAGSGNGGGSIPVTPPTPEKLAAPTIAITDDTLTITAVTNATSYEVYVNGTYKTEITTNTLDLTGLNLEAATYEITVKAKADGYTTSDASTVVSYTVEATTVGAYLVDQVVVGDYVDIGISYTNPIAPTTSYLSGTNTAMTGWRVLSTNGSGASGTVTLVSAGAPLKFYHKYSLMKAQTAIDTYFDNLNTEITIVASDNSKVGFTANGFTGGNDLASIWSSKSAILEVSSAHAMTTTELETAYEALTGIAYTMTYNASNYLMRTSNMTFKDTVLAEKGKDLLGNGISYWLGGSSSGTYSLWDVRLSGGVSDTSYYGSAYGVRPVVSLNSGVQIAGDNTGTGADVSTAFKLAE